MLDQNQENVSSTSAIRKVAGLPNIWGRMNDMPHGATATGEQSLINGANGTWINIANGNIPTNFHSFSLDASKSSSIYGSSSTVTPLSLSTKFIIRY